MGKKNKFMPAKEYLIDCYCNQNMTYRDIANMHDIDPATVCYWFKKYNLTPRAKGVLIHPHIVTDEDRQRLSRIHKGKTLTPEQRKKISEIKSLKTETGHSKVRNDGYIAVYAPNYASSNSEGYIMEHRYIMEQHIGRPLNDDEVVHHINHNRRDNEINNLRLMTFKEHAALHMKERWKSRELQSRDNCRAAM